MRQIEWECKIEKCRKVDEKKDIDSNKNHDKKSDVSNGGSKDDAKNALNALFGAKKGGGKDDKAESESGLLYNKKDDHRYKNWEHNPQQSYMTRLSKLLLEFC